MENTFLTGFMAKVEDLERTDPLQKANIDLLQLVSEAMLGKVSGQEYELRMLEVKTRIAILERQEKQGKEVLPSAPVMTEQAIKPLETKQKSTNTKIYGEKWFVIQNRLLNAITDLDLNERRLIMFLSPIVRKQLDIDPKKRVFQVYVRDFAKEYNIKGKYLYKELEKIADSILEKVFFFWYDYKGSKAKKGVSWVSECDYIENEGLIEIKLDDTVIEMLTVFDKANPFTKYERIQIVNLGSYGIILFELIASCMHQKYKQKSYTVEYLREKFNCVDSYPIATDFKRYVLDRAIKDIEKHTPYRISYTQKKKGRIISEIVFSFEDIRAKELKNNKKKSISHDSENNNNSIDGLSDPQLGRITRSSKFVQDYNHMISATSPMNQDMQAWSAHFVKLLKEDSTQFSKRPIREYLD